MYRGVSALICTLIVAACNPATPSADMPLRDAKYYEANPAEMQRMEKICDQWKGSKAPPSAFPSVVVNNCSAVLEAKEYAKRQAALRYYRGAK